MFRDHAQLDISSSMSALRKLLICTAQCVILVIRDGIDLRRCEFSLTINCYVVVEIYEIIIVWSYSCNGEIHTRRDQYFWQYYCFGKSDFCGVVNVRNLTNYLMEKLYASLKLYLLWDHIELGILIVLGIVNSRVLVSF